MDLTKGNVLKKLVLFSIPLLLTLFLSQIFILSDSLVISNTLGEDSLSYISPSQQATGIFQTIYFGLTVAGSIIMSNIFGSGNYKVLKKASFTMLTSSILICLVAAILALTLVYPTFKVIQVPDNIFTKSMNVYYIYVWTILTSIISGMASTIIQAMGDSLRPFIISLVSGILNIILDLLFILVFKMDIYGAALATVLCQLLSGIFSVILMIKMLNKIDDSKYEFDKSYLKEMLKLGIPSILQQAVMSIGSLAIVSLIYSHGDKVISANVIFDQLNSLLFIPAVGVTNAYATFAAQNFGAKNEDRIKKGFYVMHLIGLVVNTIVLIIGITLTDNLISLFSSNIEENSYKYITYSIYFSIPYYYLIVFKYGFDSLFKAKKTIKLFIFSSIFNLGLRIILAYLFNYTIGLYYINLSLPISMFVSGIVNILFWKFSKSYKKASESIYSNEIVQEDNI